LRALLLPFEELEVLTRQAVREARRDADLIDGEALFVEEHSAGEVLDVALDGSLRVACAALDIGELMS
jgi:hypothetical protein